MTGNEKDMIERAMSAFALLYAPVELVWKVWTDADHIKNWWGPNGFTNTIKKMDVAVNGEWLLTMHGPDGKNYPNKSIFREIIPNKKIVFDHYHPNYKATITFESNGDKTFMDWIGVFETKELYDVVVKTFKADEGLKQSVEKLKAYLEKMQLKN